MITTCTRFKNIDVNIIRNLKKIFIMEMEFRQFSNATLLKNMLSDSGTIRKDNLVFLCTVYDLKNIDCIE